MSAQVETDYCGRRCQISFRLYASVAELDAEISKGAAVNAKGGVNYAGRPLHYAVRYADSSVIAALLLHYGADVNRKSSYGVTPLHLAVGGGNYPTLQQTRNITLAALLLEHGAAIDAVAADGYTPVMVRVRIRGSR